MGEQSSMGAQGTPPDSISFLQMGCASCHAPFTVGLGTELKYFLVQTNVSITETTECGLELTFGIKCPVRFVI